MAALVIVDGAVSAGEDAVHAKTKATAQRALFHAKNAKGLSRGSRGVASLGPGVTKQLSPVPRES